MDKKVMDTKVIQNQSQEARGFTLVEVIVVVVVLSILVAITLPIYNIIQLRARSSAHQANIRTIHSAVQIYINDHGVPVSTPAGGWQTALQPYLVEWPTPPSGYAGHYEVTGEFQAYEIVLKVP